MKKSTKILALVALAVGLSFTSCKKCTTCEVAHGGTTTKGDEYCGSGDDVDEYEAKTKAEAIAMGGTATCTRK